MTLAEIARLAKSDPTPRKRCPGCDFVTIRATDDWCRDCRRVYGRIERRTP